MVYLCKINSFKKSFIMEFVKYLPLSVIDSFEPVYSKGNYLVYEDSNTYFYSAILENNVCAIYKWDDFSALIEFEKDTIAKNKYQEAKRIYSETIQVLNDRFPKTISYDVNQLCCMYDAKWDISSDKQILISQNKFIELYSDIKKTKWLIRIYTGRQFCVNDEKIACRICQLISADCNNLIIGRWG